MDTGIKQVFEKMDQIQESVQNLADDIQALSSDRLWNEIQHTIEVLQDSYDWPEERFVIEGFGDVMNQADENRTRMRGIWNDVKEVLIGIDYVESITDEELKRKGQLGGGKKYWFQYNGVKYDHPKSSWSQFLEDQGVY